MMPIVAASAADQGLWPRVLADIDAGDVVTVVAALIALLGALLTAGLAAVVAVKAYKTQQREGRRQERARFYAEAVQAVEDYMEAPYRIRRRDGTDESRREITQHISDVKSRLSFYTGWMAIYAGEQVRAAYDDFYRAAMSEAGKQMTEAWHGRPTKRDEDVPIGVPLDRTATNAARTVLLAAMKADLTAARRWWQR